MMLLMTIVALMSGAPPLTSPAQEKAIGSSAEKPAVAPQPKRICRKIVPVGSIMPKKFCLTQGDWRNLSDETQAKSDDILHHRGAGMCDINCLPGS